MVGHEGIVQQLLEQGRRDQLAWINGQVNQTNYARRDDVTLLNPFGGYRGRGYADGVSATRQSAIGYFESGTDASIELIQAIISDDVIVLVTIESAQVKFVGRDEPHAWVLRVTEVYRRDGNEWRKVHRHADPLVYPRSLEETLALLDPPQSQA
jgi:ketosteroid isomerase-like protein